jgi:hypothetical protein
VGERQRRDISRRQGHTQFLVDFADQRLDWPFAGFDFAAGEFPQAAMLFSFRTTLEQDPAQPVDHGCRNNNSHRSTPD